jgi:hypothetical protein
LTALSLTLCPKFHRQYPNVNIVNGTLNTKNNHRYGDDLHFTPVSSVAAKKPMPKNV